MTAYITASLKSTVPGEQFTESTGGPEGPPPVKVSCERVLVFVMLALESFQIQHEVVGKGVRLGWEVIIVEHQSGFIH